MTRHTPIVADTTADAATAAIAAGDDAGNAIARPLGHALGDELRRASRMLADLAYELGSHPDTLRRHMTSLQAIDHITQIQLTIADLLQQPPQPNPLHTITLSDMANRLQLATHNHLT